jgi:hypothetical protein
MFREVLSRKSIVARMTGFRRDGKYKDMAGHDINYIAVSGVLSMAIHHICLDDLAATSMRAGDERK